MAPLGCPLPGRSDRGRNSSTASPSATMTDDAASVSPIFQRSAVERRKDEGGMTIEVARDVEVASSLHSPPPMRRSSDSLGNDLYRPLSHARGRGHCRRASHGDMYSDRRFSLTSQSSVDSLASGASLSSNASHRSSASSRLKASLQRRCTLAMEMAVSIRRRKGHSGHRRGTDGGIAEESLDSEWSVDGSDKSNPASGHPGQYHHRKRSSFVGRLSRRTSSSELTKTGPTVIVSGRGILSTSMSLKPSDSLAKARGKLQKEFGTVKGTSGQRGSITKSGDEGPLPLLPNEFCFLYAESSSDGDDGVGAGHEVPKADESSATVSQCTSAKGEIVLKPSVQSGVRPDLPAATDDRVAELNPKARAVYLVCLRLLHQFERKKPSLSSSRRGSSSLSWKGGGARGAWDVESEYESSDRLTPDVRTALTFVESLAHFASLAGPGAPWAEHFDWSWIESGLLWVEDATMAAVQRAGTSRLAAWWTDRSERSELREAVVCVRDAVRANSKRAFGAGGSADSGATSTTEGGVEFVGGSSSRSRAAYAAAAVLSVQFDRPSSECEALRKKLTKIRIRELQNPIHDELRKEVAAHLDMNEAQLVWEVKHRRLSGGSDTGDDYMVVNAAAVHGELAATATASGVPLHRRQSSSNFFNKRASVVVEKNHANIGAGDGETLEECLAPHRCLEEDAVTNHTIVEGSGAWALDSFDNWVEEKNGRHRLYVLAAGAGLGKTAIASKIVRERDDVVVAHYFCRHDDRRSSCAKTMILSIAFQLAQRFPQYSRRITNIIAKHDLNRSKLMGDKCSLSTLFAELIEIPLHSMKMSAYSKHVIVIDGLDECHSGNATSTEPSRRLGTQRRNSDSSRSGNGAQGNEILEAIQHYFPRIPSWLKIYVTTRPILPVLGRLKRFNAHMMGADENNIMYDLRTFFTVLLNRIGLGSGEEEEEEMWASEAVETLLSKSVGVFLWAAIVADKITRLQEAGLRGEGLRRKIDRLPGGMDEILRHELFASDDVFCSGSSGSNVEGEESMPLQWRIVQLCIAAAEPLHVKTVEVLTGCNDSRRLKVALDQSSAFFQMKKDRICFRHNFVKEWLIRECSSSMGEGELVCGRKSNIRRRSGIEIGFGINNGGGFSSGSSGLLGAGMMANNGGGGGGIPDWKRAGTECCATFMASRCLSLLEDGMFLRPEYNTINDLDDTRRYVMDHAIIHLCEAKMQSRARELLFDVRWIMARSTDGEGLVQDCNALSEGDQAVQLLRRSVQLALPASQVDPRQLAGQLVGRLYHITAEGRSDDDVRQDIKTLIDGLEAHDGGFSWWCPVSSTWENAELDFIRRLDGHDSAVQTVACDRSGKRIASGMWNGKAVVWNAVSGRVDKILIGHQESVWSVAWSPCDGRLASGGLDRTIRIWNAESGKCEYVLEGHTDHVWVVAWSSNGKRIASGSRDKQIRIWNSCNGECEKLLEGRGGGVYSVAWEENGNRIASGGTDNCIYIWHAVTGDCQKVLCGHTDWVRSVVWSQDHIFSGSADRSVRIWDIATGECQQVLDGHSDSVWSVAISNDGRHVVSGSTDKTVRVWDTSVGRCEHVLTGHKGSVWSVSYSADGKKVVSGSADTSITVWDAAPAPSEAALSGHGASVWCVDLSKDGKCIVSGSSDKTVRVWNTATGFCTRAFTGQGGPVWSVALSKDARRVVAGSTNGTANIHNIATGERELVLSGHTGKIWCVAWSKDCSKVISGSQDKSLKLWDAKTGKCLRTMSGHEGDIRAICLSSRGTRVASGSSDKTIRVWNVSNGACQHVLKGVKGGVLSVAWSSDGKYLAAGSSEKVVQIFCMRTFECETTLVGHSRRINSVAWSPDGEKVATASTDKTIRVWDFRAGECQQVVTGHTGLGVYAVQWSSNGERLVSGGTDKTVRLWSASSGRCENVLTGHTGLGVYSVAWSEDGRRLVSGSRDRTVQIWDADSGECLQTLRGHTNWVCSVAWEKGGNRIASTSDDGTCRIWDSRSGECLQVLENTREVPPDFNKVSVPCITRDLSGRSKAGEPVGIQCDKVQVVNGRACAWMGKSVNFFKLVQ